MQSYEYDASIGNALSARPYFLALQINIFNDANLVQMFFLINFFL